MSKNIKEFTFPPFPKRESPHLSALTKQDKSKSGTLRSLSNLSKRPATAASTRTLTTNAKTENMQVSLLQQQIELLELETRKLREKYAKGGSDLDLNLPGEKGDIPLKDTFKLLKTKYQTLQKKHSQEKDELTQRYEALRREKQEEVERGRLLEDKIALLQDELDVVKQSRVDWRHQADNNYVELKAEFGALHSEHVATSTRYNQLKEEYAVLESKHQQTLSTISQLKEALQQSESHLLSLENKYHKFLQGQSEDEVKLVSNGYEQTIADLKHQNQSLQQAFTSLQVNHHSLQSDYATLEAVLGKCKADLEVERNTVGEWTQKYREAEMENERLKNELQSVQSSVTKFQQETTQRRKQMLEYVKNFHDGDTIPQDVLDELEKDPELMLLVIQYTKNVSVFAKVHQMLISEQNTNQDMVQRLSKECEQTLLLSENINSLKLMLEKVENSQTGVMEKLSSANASYQSVKAAKEALQKEIDLLKTEKSRWLEEHKELEKTRARVKDMEKALAKIQEWKKVVDENERISKQMFGMVKKISDVDMIPQKGLNANNMKQEPPISTISTPQSAEFEPQQRHALGIEHAHVEYLDSSLDFALEGFIEEGSDYEDDKE